MEQYPELSVLFNSCMRDFNDLLLASTERRRLDEADGSGTQSIDARIIERAFDEAGRLRLWAHDHRAGIPDRSRSSLGDSLRHSPDLRDQVAHIFQFLGHLIARARASISKSEDDGDDNFPEKDSDSDSSSTSDDSASAISHPAQRKSSRALLDIFNQIQLLYHLGILLRRPGVSRRYLKSGSKTGHQSHDLPATSPEDLSHIRERIRRWNNSQTTTGVLPEEEKEVSWEEILRRTQQTSETVPEGPVSFLIERLALANARRREQFLYWQAHPDQGFTAPPSATIPANADTKSVKSGASSLFSRNTVVKSDILGAETSYNMLSGSASEPPRTMYSETVVGGSYSSRVPDVPQASQLSETFECPYCRLELSSAAMRNRMVWRRHVFRDLRPYTCTHVSCPNAEKLYPTKHDWIYHEMQMHRRQWTCQDCQMHFSSRADMSSHLVSKHEATGHLMTLNHVLLYEQALEDTHPAGCPLCPLKSDLKSVLNHIGRHMEELSLFSLPRLAEHDEYFGKDEDEKFQETPVKPARIAHSNAADRTPVTLDEGREERAAGDPVPTSLASTVTKTAWGMMTLKQRLTIALQKANTAVEHDNSHEWDAAVGNYTDACDLLSSVISRTTDPEDIKKLTSILSTYQARITELMDIVIPHLQ
ncbi:hypothetical protein B0H63DRAFT_214264 [Podospora didyma]|uniref:C2H2-type domain-containing protein n=1 Tax=Podospora didyma TaxID=330526 RepID=A0AAE0NHX1_9PEZI|nr:hypothetical protein B0H63DRAFT_214264 [Podospora didyma]